MRIKITADSTCDLSEELLAQWDIALMPMHILMGEDSYLDGVTIHPADVFAYVNAGGKMPKSAAANLVEYTEFFEPFAKECDAVIHISVSSKLSSCFQNAKLAAGEFENVYVVDSQNICTGQGYLVLKAAKWAADGLPPRSITMRLQSLAKRVELSFVLDRLDFMAKSGRCSGVLAFGANLLGIKPALEVIDGELKVVKKYRGEGGAEEIRQLQGMPRDRHRHHHRRLFRPGYHWHRVCTEGKIKKWLLHMRQPLFLTGSGVLKFHSEWHRPHRPCSSAAAHGCRPG